MRYTWHPLSPVEEPTQMATNRNSTPATGWASVPKWLHIVFIVIVAELVVNAFVLGYMKFSGLL